MQCIYYIYIVQVYNTDLKKAGLFSWMSPSGGGTGHIYIIKITRSGVPITISQIEFLCEMSVNERWIFVFIVIFFIFYSRLLYYVFHMYT